jgi:hypothetical protein
MQALQQHGRAAAGTGSGQVAAQPAGLAPAVPQAAGAQQQRQRKRQRWWLWRVNGFSVGMSMRFAGDGSISSAAPLARKHLARFKTRARAEVAHDLALLWNELQLGQGGSPEGQNKYNHPKHRQASGCI